MRQSLLNALAVLRRGARLLLVSLSVMLLIAAGLLCGMFAIIVNAQPAALLYGLMSFAMWSLCLTVATRLVVERRARRRSQYIEVSKQ
jgi:hypothetical protein